MAQPKLLRALESGDITPIGSESSLRVDLRVIAATNHNLVAMRTDGSFRTDLYFRLSVIEIHVPPLRVRKADIPELVEHFAGTLAENSGRPFSHVGQAAVSLLADDDVIKKAYSGQLASGLDAMRDMDIVGAGFRISAGMVVNQDDRRRRFGHGGAEHIARVYH